MGDLYILPGNVSTSEPVLTTFCQVDGVDALDLWSEGCVQLVEDLLQGDWPLYLVNSFQLSLIAALYIDSSKQAHARTTLADLLRHTSIKDIGFEFSDAYDGGKLALYSYVAVSQKTPAQVHDPRSTPYLVISNTILEHSTLRLSGLRVLEMALKHVHKSAALSPDWLEVNRHGLDTILPNGLMYRFSDLIDYWVLLHLDTLLVPPLQPYLRPEDVKELEWSDTPDKVHIANARLDLYHSFLAKAVHEGAKVLKPDPELLRIFLWSNDHGVCLRAFNCCLDLVPISQSGIPEGANNTSVFIPETMGYDWVEHLVHVLCKGEYWYRVASWRFLISSLVPKWTMLPSSWCRDFASVLLSCIVQPIDMHALPAYQSLAEAHEWVSIDEKQAFLPFLATLLELTHSSLSCASLTSLENWLARLPERLRNKDAHAQMQHILVTQQPVEENLRFFAELPMAIERLEETLGFFAELPMAGEWMNG